MANKLLIATSLVFFSYAAVFAESRPTDKKEESRSKNPPYTVQKPKYIHSPQLPSQENSSNFKVNPPTRIIDSNIQVLTGSKDPYSAIYVNRKEVIPANQYQSWYYEYPLSSGQPQQITVSSSTPKALKTTERVNIDLSGLKILAAGAPVITGIRFDPITKDIILAIKDPPGVLTYNIYYADSLNSAPGTTPFTLALTDVPVSGAGITSWRDSGICTRIHPADPNIKMRFYKLEVAKVAGEDLQITNIIPGNNSCILAGAEVNIKVRIYSVSDPNPQFQFLIGGAIKQAWSSSNTYAWQTSSADTGTVEVTCQLKDTAGRQVSKTISYKIINPTAEETLKRVADNYALINDKQMDVTVTAKFKGASFGSTIYTRHYFKKPNKQRTETFEDSLRLDSAKTEIHIVNGFDTYLIDPRTGAKLRSSILADSGDTEEQLNQMDEIYHLPDFLTAHTIIRRDWPEGLANGKVILDAIPKTPNKFYSMLELYIDYFKGIETATLTFVRENDHNKLKQTLSVDESVTTLSGAWIPSKQSKAIFLTEGNVIMTYNFENIQTNTNLSDELFDPGR